MAAGDTHVADLIDTVHHAVHHDEMDSMVCNHCVYSSVRSPNRTTHPRKRACQPILMMNLQYMAVIKDSQIVGCTLSDISS